MLGRAATRARTRASQRAMPAATRSRLCSFCACFLMPNLRCKVAFHVPEVNHPGLRHSRTRIPSGRRCSGFGGAFGACCRRWCSGAADSPPCCVAVAPTGRVPGEAAAEADSLTPATAASLKPDARAMPTSRRSPRRATLSVARSRSICAFMAARYSAASRGDHDAISKLPARARLVGGQVRRAAP